MNYWIKIVRFCISVKELDRDSPDEEPVYPYNQV